VDESQVNYMRSFLETYAYEGDIYLASMKDEDKPESEPDHNTHYTNQRWNEETVMD